MDRRPGDAAGTVDVKVTTPGGWVDDANSYKYVPPPVVSNVVDPKKPQYSAYGPLAGGTQVVISGTNLAGTAYVIFGNSLSGLVTPDSVSQNSSGNWVVKATSPSATTAGPVDVFVVAPGGIYPVPISPPAASSFSNLDFTYLAAPAPTASNPLNPSSGSFAGGNELIIYGTGLGTWLTGGAKVQIGNSPAITPDEDNSNSIVIDQVPPYLGYISPTNTPVSVPVTVTTGGGWSVMGQYTYEAEYPSITSVTPATASVTVTTSVVVKGTDFENATLYLGNFQVPESSSNWAFRDSNDEIDFTIPANALGIVPGTVQLTIEIPTGYGGTYSADSSFTFTAGVYVSNLSAMLVPCDLSTPLTIFGGGFSGTATVIFTAAQGGGNIWNTTVPAADVTAATIQLTVSNVFISAATTSTAVDVRVECSGEGESSVNGAQPTDSSSVGRNRPSRA